MRTLKTQALTVVTGLLLSTAVFAAPGKAVVSHVEKVKEAAKVFADYAKARKDVSAIKSAEAFKQVTAGMKISGEDLTRIAQALADGKDYIALGIYSGKAAKDLFDGRFIEVKNADSGILGITRMSAVAGKGVATNKQLNLTADEMADAGIALQKKVQSSADLVTWDTADAQLHVDIMVKTVEIYTSTKNLTPEEAYIMAIMAVKSVDKDSAVKIARKVKEKC